MAFAVQSAVAVCLRPTMYFLCVWRGTNGCEHCVIGSLCRCFTSKLRRLAGVFISLLCMPLFVACVPDSDTTVLWCLAAVVMKSTIISRRSFSYASVGHLSVLELVFGNQA